MVTDLRLKVEISIETSVQTYHFDHITDLLARSNYFVYLIFAQALESMKTGIVK